MAKKRSSKLQAARRDKLLVKFTRPFEDGSVNGYVLDVGPRFFLVGLLGDGMRFDGFGCFRLSDVRKLEVPHPYAVFAQAAMKKLGERRPRKPRLNLASLEELLLSANRTFPLVSIHREHVDPDVCQIGRVVEVHKGRISLLEINPDASWDEEPTQYRLSEITCVDFGGEYKDALHLVAGGPPSG